MPLTLKPIWGWVFLLLIKRVGGQKNDGDQTAKGYKPANGFCFGYLINSLGVDFHQRKYAEELGLMVFTPEFSYFIKALFATFYYLAWLILIGVVCWFIWLFFRSAISDIKRDFNRLEKK